jgi:CBS domain-containing protein
MSSPAIACSVHSTLHGVAELLADREISGVPVVDEQGRVAGIISERDLSAALGAPMIRLAMKDALHTGPFLREPHRSVSARDIMSSPPVVATLDTTVREVAETMLAREINRLPVVDEGRLVGMITRHDVLAALVLPEPVAESRTPSPPIVIDD